MEDINLKATNMQEELTETHGHGQQLSGNLVGGRIKVKGAKYMLLGGSTVGGEHDAICR